MTQDPYDPGSKTSEELSELLRVYRLAIDINIISSITDTRGTILHVNDKFCKVSKYSKSELIGANHRIINSGYHPKEFFKQMWLTIGNGCPWHDEIKNKAKDGSFYWVDTVILPISNKAGKIIQYLSLRTLITEKKQAEEDRIEYIKKLREMLHMTSHRVRRPLANCLGLMDLVEPDKPLSQKELNEIINHLKSSAMELDDFTKELTIYMKDLEIKYNKKLGLSK